jgi:transglutaminase-like putative cysteine protease
VIEQRLPRNALAWIIISLFTLVAPHAARLPLWVLAVYLLAAGWRIQVYRGRWSFPGRWVKVALTGSACVGIFLSYGSLIGLEPTVALLLTAFALKLTELITRKDAYVLLFLGYFTCVTGFLFSQGLLIVLYSVLNIVLVTTALVALHQPGEHQFNRRPLKRASLMLAQAFPLMVVLFFLFPRIGPLWTVPVKSHSAKTGVSDFLKPGDISSLSQSTEVAFRVSFDGDIPRQSDLYWRGLVMSKLEDGAWQTLPYYDQPASERRPIPVERVGEPLRYDILMEPTQQRWLYGIRYARSSDGGVMETRDYRLFTLVQLEDEYRYEVESWPDALLETELSSWRRDTELILPEDGDPLTRELARQLRNGVDSDWDYVNMVLSYFREQPFVYTLQPPLLGENPMDQFLLQTRRGFCEHYAYAFVMMMRAAGVPARIVAGYLGGEVNPVNGTVIVHQFDAHAWAEVWIASQGWVRVDPTSAVSPDRIEFGLEQAMAEEGSFLSSSPLSPLRYRNIEWINSMRLRYDAITYQWQAWVVGFNGDQQLKLLNDVFGQLTAAKFVLVVIGTWVLVLLPVGFSLLRRKRIHPLAPQDKLYLEFCDTVAHMGVARDPGEAPGDYARRASQKLPLLAESVQDISKQYDQLAYAGVATFSSGDFDLFKKAVKRFKLQRLLKT